MIDYNKTSNDEQFNFFEEHVLVGECEWRVVYLKESYAKAIVELRRSGLDVDNLTINCYRYAQEQGVSDRDFCMLLEWWIYNLDPKNPNSPYRFLVENYRCGSFEGFKGMKHAA